MKRARASKTRAKIYSVISSLPSTGLTSSQIAKKLQKLHKKEIDAETNEIFEVGLLRLISDALRSRKGAVPSLQLELFEEYKIKKTFVIRTNTENGIAYIHKDIGDLTVEEAEIYVEQHQRPRVSRNPKIAELARFVADMKNEGAAPSDLLIKAWERHRESA